MLINKISKGLYLRFLSRCRVAHLSENLDQRFYSDFRREGFQACRYFFGKRCTQKMIISLFNFLLDKLCQLNTHIRSRVQEITFIWKIRWFNSNMFRVLTFFDFLYFVGWREEWLFWGTDLESQSTAFVLCWQSGVLKQFSCPNSFILV